jgi:hypothetical protein
MNALRIGGAAAMAVLLAACPGDNGRQDTVPAIDTPSPPPDEAGATLVPLTPLAGSGVHGEATITPTGTRTEVAIRLTGATPGRKDGHVHEGTCAAKGAVVGELEAVEVAPDGTGSATTMLDLAPMELMDGHHLIAYHEAGGGHDGQHVVCGEIPGPRP